MSSERELKTMFKKQALVSFLDILDRLKRDRIKGSSPKENLLMFYQQMDSVTRDEIQEITDDVAQAITNSELRDALIYYAENKLLGKKVLKQR